MMSNRPRPWYTPGMRAIAGDIPYLIARIEATDSAVLVREYDAINTASTTAQRMLNLVPEGVELHMTSRKLPAGPTGEFGVTGVFAYITPEQLGRLTQLRAYVGQPVEGEIDLDGDLTGDLYETDAGEAV